MYRTRLFNSEMTFERIRSYIILESIYRRKQQNYNKFINVDTSCEYDFNQKRGL